MILLDLCHRTQHWILRGPWFNPVIIQVKYTTLKASGVYEWRCTTLLAEEGSASFSLWYKQYADMLSLLDVWTLWTHKEAEV